MNEIMQTLYEFFGVFDYEILTVADLMKYVIIISAGMGFITFVFKCIFSLAGGRFRL